MANKFRNRLSKYFGITTTKNADGVKKPDIDTTSFDGGKSTKIDSPLQTFFKYWRDEVHDSTESLRHRENRYRDIDFMVVNSAIISMALDLYCDEATQIDAQSQILQVLEANSKVTAEIKKCFDHWGYGPQTIRSMIRNIAEYGEHFNINAFSETEGGLVNTRPLGMLKVEDRVEFDPLVEDRNNLAKDKYAQFKNQVPRYKNIINALEKKPDPYELYSSHLFGFKLKDSGYVAPWTITHFRLGGNVTEFAPWGRSIFINAISPYRQLKASMNLMTFARAESFPKEKFTVGTNTDMSTGDRWAMINMAREQYHNIGLDKPSTTEDFPVGGQIWTAKDLFDYDVVKSDIRLSDIADVELLRDNLIMSTRIPKGYLVVDRGGWGVSGTALLQQFKPFGRGVFNLQTAFLEGVTHQLKLHFISKDLFDGEDTKFTLAMNFPVIEESQDRLSMKRDTLDLATSVINAIQDTLGVDSLPVEIIQSIFSKISFLSPEEVLNWISYEKEMSTKESRKSLISLHSLSESEKNRITSRLHEDIVMEAYLLEKKKHNIYEGVTHKRHFLSSWVPNTEHDQIYKDLKAIYKAQSLKEKSEEELE